MSTVLNESGLEQSLDEVPAYLRETENDDAPYI
jgi:hypothetical protein